MPSLSCPPSHARGGSAGTHLILAAAFGHEQSASVILRAQPHQCLWLGVRAYEHDPICQSRKGGLLKAKPAGTHSRLLLPVSEVAGGAIDPVVSGSVATSNFCVQRWCCQAVLEL